MGPVKRKMPHVDHRSPKRQRKSENAGEPTKLLREEEAAFPRGGASILTPLEHKQIQIDATRDVLFEQSASGKLGGSDDGGGVNSASEAPRRQKKTRAKKSKGTNAGTEKEASEVRIESLSYKVSYSPYG